MISRIGVVYAKNATKLSKSIGPCVIDDEKNLGQRHDQSYMYDL